MENDRNGDLREAIDDAAHELDIRRAEALEAIDKAPFSWFHVKVCLVAGAGFFTDAYDIFAINLASVMLGFVYGNSSASSGLLPRLSSDQDFGIKVAAPIGNLFGQLLFGWLADILGRKRMYGIELMIIITATLAQALSASGPALNIIGVIVFWRFIMGIGIGGDYPLSAVITSEFASKRIRGRLMTAVFTAQGWGNLAASLVAFIVVAAYKESIIADVNDRGVDTCWRILIGLGCVPGVIALYFRLTIPETPRFTMDIDRDVRRAATDINNVLGPRGDSAGIYWVNPDADEVVQRAYVPHRSRSDFMAYFGQWPHLKLLIGVAYSWFAIDVVFYGLGLNSTTILTSDVLTLAGIGNPFDSADTTGATNNGLTNTTASGRYKTLHNVAEGSLVVSLAGLLPGYYATFFCIDVWGRKPIQFMGFSALTVLLAILAGIYPGSSPSDKHKTKAFVALYCLANFFSNFGPNVTTFVIPGEMFPTRYRSTAHGIAAASGKLGAIVSQIIFFKVSKSERTLKEVLGIYAAVALTGIASTLLLDETMGQSLEELSREKQQGFVHGVAMVEMRNGVVHRRGSVNT